LNSGGSTINGRGSTSAVCPATPGKTCDQFFTGRQEIQTVKVGVNYKFWGGY